MTTDTDSASSDSASPDSGSSDNASPDSSGSSGSSDSGANGGTDTLVRRHVVIIGRVQGVGYRATCTHRAKRTGVAGWVRNRGDGSVEAVFEGSPEAVERMVGWCHHGPPMAHVRQVVATEETPTREVGFQIR